MEVPPRIELGIRELQSHALPLGYGTVDGADDEARTRYLHLGKVALYQMSYIRKVDVFGQNRFPVGKPRRFQQSTGLLPRAAFRFRLSAKQKRWCLRAESLSCGKATAVATVHRTVAKSRLSIPLVSETKTLVPPGGIEPPTRGFSVPCSTD